MMEYVVYNLRLVLVIFQPNLTLVYRPHLQDDKDLNIPPEEAIIPNPMLEHSDILEVVLNIRNPSLRKSILLKENINYDLADRILFKVTEPDTEFNSGDTVALRVETAMQLPERLLKVEMVISVT